MNVGIQKVLESLKNLNLLFIWMDLNGNIN